MTTTPKPQTGMWILTAPNGKQWQADSPLKVCGAEQRERVPAEVGLSRVFAAIAQPAEKCFCDANNLGAPSVSCGDCPTRDYNIAQPEQQAMWHPTETAITALKRFEETCTDNEGYDVPKDTMRNLAAIGLIYRTYGDMYCITDFGRHILANPIAQPEQPATPKDKILANKD